MFQIPQQPLSPWSIFTASFGLYRFTFKKCLPFLALVALCSIAEHALFNRYFAHAAATGNLSASLNIIIMLVNLVASLLGSCVVVQIGLMLKSQTASWSEVLASGLLRGCLLLIGLAVISLIITAMAILLILVGSRIPPFGQPVAIAIVVLFLLYILVVLTPWMMLLLGGENPIKALKHSFHLVHHAWWRTFALVLLVGIGATIISGIVYLFTGTSFAQVLQAAPATVGTYIASMVIVFIIPSWLWGALWLQTRDLMMRKDELAD